MSAPLTHHEIVKHAAPLTRLGLSVDLDNTDRQARVIAFQVRELKTQTTGMSYDKSVAASSDLSVRECCCLSILKDNGVELCRALSDKSRLIATLTARADSLEKLLNIFFDMNSSQLLYSEDQFRIAFSYTLEPTHYGSADSRLRLQQVVARCDRLELRTDVSTTFGMPADTLLIHKLDTHAHRARTLASGSTSAEASLAGRILLSSLKPDSGSAEPMESAPDSQGTFQSGLRKVDLPEDLLALLGAHWRPLVWQGGYWKTVMRQLGKEPKRTAIAREHAINAMRHIARVQKLGPSKYHQQFASARLYAWLRRLRPLMLLAAIMATVPIVWVGMKLTGLTLHPLAMGLTPLLLMGVVMMGSREFPVMELPPLPKALKPKQWALSDPASVDSRSADSNTQ